MLYTLINHATISQWQSLLENFKLSDWLNTTNAVKNVKPSKFTICNSLQTEIVRQVEINTFAECSFSLWQNLKLKCSMKPPELWLIKTRKFFYRTSRKQTAQGVCFMNERRPNSQKNEDRSGWQRRKTGLLRLTWPSTRRIGKISEQAPSCWLEGWPM